MFGGFCKQPGKDGAAATIGRVPVRFSVWLPVLVGDYLAEILFRVIENSSVVFVFGNDVNKKVIFSGSATRVCYVSLSAGA